MVQQLAPAATSLMFDDPLLSDQWNLSNNGDLRPTKFVKGADVNVEKAWELTTGDPSIVVAVLDEGIDVNHPIYCISANTIISRSCCYTDFITFFNYSLTKVGI